MTVLLATTGSFAQITQSSDHATDKQQDLLGQGNIHVGVDVNAGYGGYVGMVGRVVPRLQYFLKDGWSVALEGRYETSGRQFSYAGAGVSTRYYFIRDRRLAVFGQAGATYGRSMYRTYRYDPANPYSTYQNFSEQKTNAWQATAGLGVHYRVSKRWSLEGVMERTLTNRIGFSTNYSRWQGSVGVNFRLGK